MGTKNKPGIFDCYANAEPDEPMFVLLARDVKAPALVEEWVRRRQAARTIALGALGQPVTLDDKAREALACAEAMREWRERKGV